MKKFSLILALAAAATALPASASAQTAVPTTSTAEAGKAPAVKLETLVGVYEIMPGRGITVTLEKDSLRAMAPNGEGVTLTLKAGTEFIIEGKQVWVSFTMDKNGKPTELVMHDGDAQRVFARKNDN